MLNKLVTVVLLATAIFIVSVYFLVYKPTFKLRATASSKKPWTEKLISKLHSKAEALQQFANKKYSDKICFLIDMSIESGRNRFFVYDIKNDSILLAGLVAHGSCDDGFRTEAVFSNAVNSGCSSIGKFKIGNSYTGNFGLAYKLSGLDSTNSNAYKRFVVLHSYSCVPEQETYPLPICNSRGCPMIAPGFMKRLQPIIAKEDKPIILWTFR